MPTAAQANAAARAALIEHCRAFCEGGRAAEVLERLLASDDERMVADALRFATAYGIGAPLNRSIVAHVDGGFEEVLQEIAARREVEAGAEQSPAKTWDTTYRPEVRALPPAPAPGPRQSGGPWRVPKTVPLYGTPYSMIADDDDEEPS